MSGTDILSHFEKVRNVGDGKWEACCPAHDDDKPSLSVTLSEGKWLLCCHAGCPVEAVTAAARLEVKDLFNDDVGRRKDRPKTPAKTSKGPKAYFTLDDALSGYDRLQKGYERVAVYEYLEGRVARYESPDDKRFGQFTCQGQLWYCKSPTTFHVKWSPYRLHELNGDTTVFLVEGEKCTDELWKIGIPAVTSAGGCKAVKSTDWSSLAGKTVVIIPDNDGPGAKYADQVTAMLQSLNPPATVKRLELVGLPNHGDVVDWMDARDAVEPDALRAELLALAVALPDPPESDLAGVLDDVAGFLERYMHFESGEQLTAVVLWIAYTYRYSDYDVAPYLHLRSPEKRSGKTLLLDLLELLVRDPLATTDISPAALFRVIEDRHPTVLIDEVDAIFPKRGKSDPSKDDLRGLLNAGYRKGRPAYRMGGSNNKTLEEFDVFSMKALAGIGELPDTVADRLIPIHLQRKPRHIRKERCRLRNVRPIAKNLESALRSIMKNMDCSHDEPPLPNELNDRAQDNWEPLLALADRAGEAWGGRARAAAVVIQEETDDADTVGIKLLTDLRQIWETGLPAMSSKEILDRLTKLEEAKWGTWFKGNPIKADFLASHLKPFGVESTKVKYGGQSLRGYRLDELQSVWDRYLATKVEPTEPTEPVHAMFDDDTT